MSAIVQFRTKSRMGRPKGGTNQAAAERDARIVDVARSLTDRASQTVRHIYYRCSALGIVSKDEAGSIIVQKAIKKARWSGTLEWDRIVDGSRELIKPVFWKDKQDFLYNVIPQFRLNKWAGQQIRPIVCSEKDAITSILRPVCGQYGVPLIPFRGHESDSMLYEFADYLRQQHEDEGHNCFQIFYLGDWDANGLDIDRCIFGNHSSGVVSSVAAGISEGKLGQMLAEHIYSSGEMVVRYKRLGITKAHVIDPENAPYILPAKNNKFRDRFVQETGSDETLGIDALSHEALDDLVRSAVESCIDRRIWAKQEEQYQKQLTELKQAIL